MNRLRSVIPTLIQINIVVAILSVVFIVIIREQQAQMTAYTQQSFDKSRAVPRQIKEKIVDYQEKIQENHQKIDDYEQQLKGLQAEIQEYKSQNGLLMQVNRSGPPRNTLIASVKEQKTIDLSKKSQVRNSFPTVWVESGTSLRPQSVSKPSSSQPKTTVKSRTSSRSGPIQSIQIDNDQFPSLARNFSTVEAVLPPTRLTPENIQAEAKKTGVANSLPPEPNEENKNRQNSNNNITQIAQNTDPQRLSINSLEEVTTKPFTSNKIPSLQANNERYDSIYYANNIAYGLAIAVDEKQINHGTKMYRKVQTAIKLLRKGESKEEATRKADVPPTVMNQLLKWGEKRPASLLNETKQEQK